jgi:hypothetical protein
MPVNRPVKKLTALVLAGAAVAVAAETGTQALAAESGARPVSAITDNQGNPNAVPPILRPARPSELAEIGRAEAQEAQAFQYRLPPTAQYSDAEMNVFATEGYGADA